MDEKKVSRVEEKDLLPDDFFQHLTDLYMTMWQMHLESYKINEHRLQMIEDRAALVEQALQRR